VLDAVARTVAVSTRAAGVRVEAFGACVEVGEPVSSAAAMRVPLLSGEVAVGSMSVSPQPGRRWRSDEVSLLGELGRHAGLAVDSARLAEEVAEHHRAVVGAREEERRLLGRELHDDLGPTVAGLALQLGALRPLVRSDPETVVARLARLEETAATALADIRRVAHQLRPPVLDQVGLGSAVLAVAESLGLTVVEQVVEHDRLPAAVELAAYRIAAEALANVARHAGSAGVRLEIRQAGGTLLVVVSDEGRGFSVGSAGLGLTTMRERAEELRGTLSVRTGEHGGTVVTAVLPLAVPQTRRLVPEEEP
jgi:signal transduction histidine kinase